MRLSNSKLIENANSWTDNFPEQDLSKTDRKLDTLLAYLTEKKGQSSVQTYSMNGLNQTESATFAIFLYLAFYSGSVLFFCMLLFMALFIVS